MVSGTTEPDSVLTVAECMAVAALATARPVWARAGNACDRNRPPTVSASLPGDIDRWVEANEITETYGIELVEWFVVGPAGVDCPRELLGEPERW